MANIDFRINFNDSDVKAKLAAIEAKANAASVAFNKLAAATGHSFADIKGFQKTIADADRLNAILNRTTQTAQQAGNSMAGSFFQSSLAAGVLLNVFNKIEEVAIRIGKEIIDWAKEGYKSAVEIKRAQEGLKELLVEQGHKDVDEEIKKLDRLADRLMFYGQHKQDILEVEKKYAVSFPGANTAGIENLTKATVALSSINHRSLSQNQNAIRLVTAAFEQGSAGGRLQLKNLWLSGKKMAELTEVMKASKKAGTLDPEKYTKDLVQGIIKITAGPAYKEAMVDPLLNFRTRLEQVQNKLGDDIMNALASPEVQARLEKFAAWLEDIIKNTDWSKAITVFIDALLDGAMKFVTVMQSVVSWLGWALNIKVITEGEQKSRTKYASQFLEENPQFTQDKKPLGMFGPNIKAMSAGNLAANAGKNSLIASDREEQETFEKWLGGRSPLIDKIQKMKDKFDDKMNVLAPITASVNDKYGAGNKDSQFDVANETSKVTGNRPVIININIDKQVEHLDIHSSTLTESKEQIQDFIISTIDDALMSAESIMGSN